MRSYAIQFSIDEGETWQPHGPDPSGVIKADTDANVVVRILLDTAYKQRAEGSGDEPLGIVRVFLWNGEEMAGPPDAIAGTGTDWTYRAYGRLLKELADDLTSFEEERKEALARAASAQTAITNVRSRMARVAREAVERGMPQVDIANSARRSREWVRRIQGGDKQEEL